MSWITGFADKAEQMLVKIDQSAAEKLQKKKSTKPVEDTVLTEVTTVSSPIQQRARLSPPPSPRKPTLPTVKSAPVMVNQSQEEEKLIDFLNDNSKPSSQVNGGSCSLGILNVEGGTDLEGEKQMLKNEVRVLNNELSLLLHRTRAAEKESEILKAELQEVEKSRLSLQDEGNKLQTRVKNLEQQNQTVITEKKELEEQKISSGAQLEQFLQLQQQLKTLQDQQQSLNLSLEQKERERLSLENLSQQQQQECALLNQRLLELRTELEQYRARAQRTLSHKEQLISQLRANNSEAAVETSFQTELEQLREEKQTLAQEHEETCAQLDVLRARLAETELTLERVREGAARTHQELQDRVAQEVQKRRIIEDDYRAQSQELRLVREEASVQRSQLNSRLREREAELTQLRAPSPSPLKPGELEMRMSSLTKTLIHKQTALESATTERNQLRMQLEELEHKHREHLLMLHQARLVSANDTDDAKAQVPSFLVESPFDTGVARRVKRAYSSLDAVSIRTGVFLRRYPLARILVILYVVLLHLLVLLVLCSRTPDNAQK